MRRLGDWESESVAGLARRVERRVRVDARSLALFRVSMGVLAAVDVLLRARNFQYFYTDAGVVPQTVAMDVLGGAAVSVYFLSPGPRVTAALFAIQFLVALGLIVGCKTRTATLLTFLLAVSLDHRNPLVLSHADPLFRLLLFWGLFVPLGERWSIDAVHRERDSRAAVAGVGTTLLLGQMVYMYARNGAHKLGVDIWESGEAAVLVLGLDDTTYLLGDFVGNFHALVQLGGVTWYYMLLGSWLLLVLVGRRRAMLAGLFVLGHLSFALTVRIGAFPYVAIAGLFPFFQREVWDDAGALARRLGLGPRAPAGLGRLARAVPAVKFAFPRRETVRQSLHAVSLAVVVLYLLVFVAFTFVPVGGVDERTVRPEKAVEQTAGTVGLAQPEWKVFAPQPRTRDRYYVFPARTADGDMVDAYNDRPLTYERPFEDLHRQYDTYRERFYMSNVRKWSVFNNATLRLAEHVCTTWREERNVTLTHVNMYVVDEDVTMHTTDSPSDRRKRLFLIYRHGCGDNEPVEFETPQIAQNENASG